jgi:hypothetical protein
VRRAAVRTIAVLALLGAAPVAAAASLHWSGPVQIDTNPSESSIDAISCVSATWCVAADEFGHAFAGNPQAGRGSWTRGLTVFGISGAVDCVSETLCIQTGEGAIATSTEPAAGVWSRVKLDGDFSIHGLACPSATLCVAGDSAGNVLTATDPAGGSGAWSIGAADPHNSINAVSCPTTTLCVAVDDGGNVVISTNPSGGAAAWTVTHEDNGRNTLASVSCPTTTLCVAVDNDGNVLTTTQPSNSAVPWTITSLSSQPFNSVSCTAAPFCVAIGGAAIEVSTAPTGGAGAWTSSPNMLGDLADEDVVECVAGPFCLAGDNNGEVQATPDPIVGTALTWTATPLSGLALAAVACPAANFCTTGDDLGQMLVTSDPAGSSPWTNAANLNDPLQGLSCASKSLCVATAGDYGDGDTGGFGYVSGKPGTTRKWSAFDPAEHNPKSDFVPLEYFGVSCPSSHLCGLVGERGLYISTTPTKGRSWKHLKQRHGKGADVYCPRTGRCAAPNGSCPSRSLCVDLAGSGKILVGGPGHSWKSKTIDQGARLTGIACPSKTMCVAVDDHGNGIVTSDPTGGAGVWHKVPIDGGEPLDAVACASRSLCVAVDDSGYAVTGTR